MERRELALGQALSRTAVGVAMIARPELGLGPWIGADAKRPAVGLASRALGAREMVLGLGQLGALRAGFGVRPWLVGGLLADSVDLWATLKARDDIPSTGAVGVAAVAAGSAALCAYLLRGLD